MRGSRSFLPFVVLLSLVSADLWGDSFKIKSGEFQIQPRKKGRSEDQGFRGISTVDDNVDENSPLILDDKIRLRIPNHADHGNLDWTTWEKSVDDCSKTQDVDDDGNLIEVDDDGNVIEVGDELAENMDNNLAEPIDVDEEQEREDDEEEEDENEEADYSPEDDLDNDDEDDAELPLNHYSDDYIKSLRQIGIENIAHKAKGITYSFYTDTRSCKPPDQIQKDVQRLDFEVIRIYDTDCNGLETILQVLKPNQKVFAGIYYLERLEESINIIANSVMTAGKGDWHKIYTVSVGNELINFNKVETREIGAAVQNAKALLRAKGYNGPVVSTDTLVAMLNHPELCSMSDYISVNSHPYWDGYVKPQDAGPWLKQQLEMLDSVCGNNGAKDIILSEVGWPTRGMKYGNYGVPSRDNQLIAIKSIVDTMGPKTILFTTFNDYWKDGGSHGVEKFWGIFDDAQ